MKDISRGPDCKATDVKELVLAMSDGDVHLVLQGGYQERLRADEGADELRRRVHPRLQGQACGERADVGHATDTCWSWKNLGSTRARPRTAPG
eukprot:9269566-Pyramimonas_sp.AAC.1